MWEAPLEGLHFVLGMCLPDASVLPKRRTATLPRGRRVPSLEARPHYQFMWVMPLSLVTRRAHEKIIAYELFLQYTTAITCYNERVHCHTLFGPVWTAGTSAIKKPLFPFAPRDQATLHTSMGRFFTKLCVCVCLCCVCGRWHE